MKNYKMYAQPTYGELDPKVDLDPKHVFIYPLASWVDDELVRRRPEVLKEEAAFYKSITEPYSVDDELDKYYVECTASDGYKIPIKVYSPKNKKGVLPAHIFIHGGAWITCNIETHDYVPSYIAARANQVCFSIEYRLAPEYKFPIPVEDCYTAAKWIVENAERFGIDADKVSVGGDSAGGNLSAAVSIMARDRKDFDLQKQVLMFGAYDRSRTEPTISEKRYMPNREPASKDANQLNDRYIGDADPTDARISPMKAKDLTNLPDALFIQPECDFLIDDGMMYAQLLADNGNKVKVEVYNGMPHGFIQRVYKESFDALDEVCGFLKY